MNYAIPTLLLTLTIACFFIGSQGRYRPFGLAQSGLRVLVALPLLLSGIVLHFFRLQTTAAIIPPGFPAPLFLVQLTGVLEVLGAIGLFLPSWQRRAAFLLAVLMVAIFPANVFAAGQTVGGLHMPGVPVRTAMQVVFILLILLAGFGRPARTVGTAKG